MPCIPENDYKPMAALMAQYGIDAILIPDHPLNRVVWTQRRLSQQLGSELGWVYTPIAECYYTHDLPSDVVARTPSEIAGLDKTLDAALAHYGVTKVWIRK